MGACCGPLELKNNINDKDIIKILWPFDSKHDLNKELLQKFITKADIESISDLKIYLKKLRDKEIVNENEIFLICLKIDAESNANIINEINRIVKVFVVGEFDKAFKSKTGKKFYSPEPVFRKIIRSCMIELEYLRNIREEKKNRK